MGERVPRLELILALTAASAGLVIASVSENLGLVPLTWEPAVFGALAGVAAGFFLRRQCSQDGDLPHDASGRWRFLRTWLALGAGAGGLVCFVVPLTLPAFLPPTIFEGLAFGGIAALVVYPGCLALLWQARIAVRARLGSFVAGADRRAIWGAAALVLSVVSLAALIRPTLASMVVAATGCLISLVVYLLDRSASDRVSGLITERDEMDALDTDTEEVAATDLGVGDELAGHTEAGGTYRARARRVPLLRGSIEEATAMLDRCRLASGRRLVLAVALWVLQGIVAR